MKRIILEWDPTTAERTVTVEGFPGKSCVTAARFLNEALGGELIESKPTAETTLPTPSPAKATVKAR